MPEHRHRAVANLTGVCLLMLLAAAAPSLHAQQVIEYSARYKASANGISALAQRTLEKTSASAYRLSNTLQAEIFDQLIAKLEQTSEFELVAGKLIPQSYSYLLSGISSESKTIAYNWDAAIALSTEDDRSWSIALTGSELDQLSHQFVLRQLIQSSTLTEFEFNLIDEDEVETHRYRVIADEVLQTPLGRLNTVKLQRVRAAEDDRQTIIWLARDWDLLLVRIDQVSASGLSIKLELEQAIVGEAEVTALP